MSKGKEKVTAKSEEQDKETDGQVVTDHSKSRYWVGFDSPESTKVNPNWLRLALACSSDKPQDADYSSYIPSLNYELENIILARFPRSEYWKLSFVNKRFAGLVKNEELFKIRRDIGFSEPSVLMLASGENSWWAFDQGFSSLRRLPVLPSDICFTSGDKESLCAGTHLLVSGREIEGLMIWRYELALNKWFKGPSMIYPRCLFASATCGNSAYVAGGIAVVGAGTGGTQSVHNTVEKYDPETRSWTPLPRMKKPRKLCSGCYMDDRFYVIGGRNEDGELTCGEFFDSEKNQWNLIPEMLKDNPVLSCHSPPLIAVVKNELYSIEASSNQLKVYLKKSNSWKQLGSVPVRADYNRGWGVAFKSFGNKLLVIGASTVSPSRSSMAIYTCSPEPESEFLPEWELLDNGKIQLSHFIMNCSVMVA
ncbi:galactose oxidase/kelch repeat superfamily protein [Artemisia annua]|uniref:Galactose oxidase/kelch repeat superfamily protein n=1 Tax=Artemisia annua TaxID=35608 RepID=A0A2U1N204_ARTAN|nr:galactose oxidase/kelch repeat superfamily protein [Artemisia annua]